MKGASALEISGLLELIDAECRARGWKLDRMRREVGLGVET